MPRWRRSASTSTAGSRSTPARRRAASPTACSNAARRHVVALDVGHGQLHPKVRDDPRVTVIERINVRDLRAGAARRAARRSSSPTSRSSRSRRWSPSLAAVAAPGRGPGPARQAAVRGGPPGGGARHRASSPTRTCTSACAARSREALRVADCAVRGWTDSPITGADGNREFLVHANAPERERR